MNSTKTEIALPVATDSEKILRLIHEILDTLAIAFVLAFLFKTFEGELYVIPTGSMAPTLMGRHKDVHCPECDCPYQVSASEEFEAGTNTQKDSRVIAGTCPQCRYSAYFGENNTEKKVYPSYKGDYILVNKYIMDFKRPSRWHVTVFRYPGEPQVNYIKRMIGLENETIQIRNGNIYVKKEEEESFRIARKTKDALKAMLQLVYCSDYENDKFIQAGFPARWSQEMDAPLAWQTVDYRSFTTQPTDQMSWLRYQHRVPASFDWDAMKQGIYSPETMPIPAQLITDFTAYNTNITYHGTSNLSNSFASHTRVRARTVTIDGKNVVQYVSTPQPENLGVNWVSDLALECRLTVDRPEGVFCMELVRGGIGFRCELDLSTGKATLSAPELSGFTAVEGQTPIKKSGRWNILFTNIDDQLRLFVGSKEIIFEGDGIYAIDSTIAPTERDLTPVSLGAQNASLKVESLSIKRDIYYIASDNTTDGMVIACDLLSQPDITRITESQLRDWLSTPSRWRAFGQTRTLEYALGKGEFLVLGDNSAKSSDSRLWQQGGFPGENFERHVVPEKYLIGEALFVYWPHGQRLPGTNLNIVPNISKMRFIK